MGRFILIIIFIAVAGAGGYFGYTFFKPKQEVSQDESQTAAVIRKPPVYVEMKPFVLPILDNDGPAQVVTLIVTLEMADDSAAQLVKDFMPRLTDAYMRVLYGAFDRKTVTNGRLLNVDLVKDKLYIATQRVMGENIVNRVLVQAIAQRQL